MMNRRDFLKTGILCSFGLTLPAQLGATLTIVDIKLLDSFRETMTFGGARIVDGQAVMSVSIDTMALWQHIRLVDEDGREWTTNDQGATWQCGLMEFSLKGE